MSITDARAQLTDDYKQSMQDRDYQLKIGNKKDKNRNEGKWRRYETYFGKGPKFDETWLGAFLKYNQQYLFFNRQVHTLTLQTAFVDAWLLWQLWVLRYCRGAASQYWTALRARKTWIRKHRFLWSLTAKVSQMDFKRSRHEPNVVGSLIIFVAPLTSISQLEETTYRSFLHEIKWRSEFQTKKTACADMQNGLDGYIRQQKTMTRRCWSQHQFTYLL